MLRINATQLKRTAHVVQFSHLVNRGYCTGGDFERGWGRSSAQILPPTARYSWISSPPQSVVASGLSRGVIRVVVEDKTGDQLSTVRERTRTHIDGERRKYRELFQFAPACYLQTDPLEHITEVN